MQPIPFGEYMDRILGYANETFATLYHHHFKKYWHDGSFYAKMTQNYTTTDWQNGIFETYIPTRDATHGLSYYRIAIKIVESTNNQEFKEEAKKLRVPLHMPPGQIDSEFQIIISQRLNRWGFIRAINHTRAKIKGYQTNIYITNRREKASATCNGGNLIVTPPEVLWVKILRQICGFLNIRINRYLDAMKLKRWMLPAKDNNQLYYTCINSAVFSLFGESLRRSVLCMSQTLDVLLHKIWSIQEDIGNQNIANRAIRPLLNLSPDKLADVFVYIRKELDANLKSNAPKLNRHELLLLHTKTHGGMIG